MSLSLWVVLAPSLSCVVTVFFLIYTGYAQLIIEKKERGKNVFYSTSIMLRGSSKDRALGFFEWSQGETALV